MLAKNPKFIYSRLINETIIAPNGNVEGSRYKKI